VAAVPYSTLAGATSVRVELDAALAAGAAMTVNEAATSRVANEPDHPATRRLFLDNVPLFTLDQRKHGEGLPR
jgi:hypothetical protein